jgi:hypothetical protein
MGCVAEERWLYSSSRSSWKGVEPKVGERTAEGLSVEGAFKERLRRRRCEEPASTVEGENATLLSGVCRTVLRRADSSGGGKSPHEETRGGRIRWWRIGRIRGSGTVAECGYSSSKGKVEEQAKRGRLVGEAVAAELSRTRVAGAKG